MEHSLGRDSKEIPKENKLTGEILTSDRTIKKHFYGRNQQAIICVPPGFKSIVKNEIYEILQSTAQLQTADEKPEEKFIISESHDGQLKIENIELNFLLELLVRMTTATDIKLVIHKGRAPGYAALKRECGQFKLALYFPGAYQLQIKAHAQASQVFMDREIVAVLETELLKQENHNRKSGVKRTQSKIKAPPYSFNLTANLYRDMFTLDVSLAGEHPLAHRGYKKSLVGIAPLREDIAACILKSVGKTLANWHSKSSYEPPDFCYVPFAGSGTFLFEALLLWKKIPPYIFRSNYALEQMNFFKPAMFSNLKKRILLDRDSDLDLKNAHKTHFIATENNTTQFNGLKENWNYFSEKLVQHDLELPEHQLNLSDFFDESAQALESRDSSDNLLKKLHGRVFIPLNPPYGMRLNAPNEKAASVDLYSKIGDKLTKIKKHFGKKIKHIEGCILCPSEEQWKDFLNTIPTQAKTHTHHFSQGGVDIRLVTFLL